MIEKLLDKFKKRRFNVTIRLKVPDPNYMEDMEPISDYFKKYFNNFYQELSILGDYRSIQEHTNRAKFIDLCDKKINDLSRFYLSTKALIYYQDIKLYTKKKLHYGLFHRRIATMADYLSVIYQNMKTGFLPESDVNYALQTMFYNSINLEQLSKGKEENCALNCTVNNREEPENTIDSAKPTYGEIERLMRICLLKESIDSKYFPTRIEEGALLLISRFFTFNFKISGSLQNPHWILVGVNAQNSKVEEMISQAFGNLKQTIIEKVTDFVIFYENKYSAQRIFDKLENKKGYLKNFSGFYKGMSLSGEITGENIFRLVKIENGRKVEVDPYSIE